MTPPTPPATTKRCPSSVACALSLASDVLDSRGKGRDAGTRPCWGVRYLGSPRGGKGMRYAYAQEAPVVRAANRTGGYPARAADVPGVLRRRQAANQGIAAGQMGRVIDAIRAGAAYGNVHSTMFPGGETRGQLRTARD